MKAEDKIISFADVALKYHERGISVIPILRGKKPPLLKEWSQYALKLMPVSLIHKLVESYPDAGVAVVLGPSPNLMSFDVDVPESAENQYIFDIVNDLLPASPVERFGSKGFQRFFQYNEELPRKQVINLDGLNKIELLTAGQCSYIPPTIHYKTGKQIIWTKKSLLDVDTQDLPKLSLKTFNKIKETVLKEFQLRFPTTPSKSEKAIVVESGRNDKLKSMATAALKSGKSVEEICVELISFDLKFHATPLFSDESEGFVSTPEENATIFIESIKRSLEDDTRKGSYEPEFILYGSEKEDLKTNWIVERLFGEGQVSILAGPPKSGKSTLARQFLVSVSNGELFLGRQCETGSVLYCSAEESPAQFTPQFNLLGGRKFGNIHYNKSSGCKVEQIIEKAIRENVRLIVIDTLDKFFSIPDINDYSCVNKAFSRVLPLIKESKAHLMLVHHTTKGERKGASSILGSTALRGLTDINVLFDGEGTSNRTISTEGREVTIINKAPLEFNEETKSYSMPDDGFDDRTSLLKKRILKYLTDKPGESITAEQLQSILSSRKKNVTDALTCLYREEKVGRVGTGKKGSPFTYSVPL